MAKLTRETLKQFGSTGGSSNFGKFGSQAVGAPVTTKTISTIQSLTAWLNGWQDAVAAGQAPYLQDMNSLFYVLAYEQCYTLQEGTPEYDAATTYWIGSLVKRTGTSEIYMSLIDTNLGHALPTAGTSDANWQFVSGLISSSFRIGGPLAMNTAKVTGIGNATAAQDAVALSQIIAPTVQKFTSSSGTYTLPTSPRAPIYIRVRMVGGGGGGSGGGTASFGNGGAGGNTTFGTTLLAANGGSGGATGSGDSPPVNGGTASLGSGPVGIAVPGGMGSGNGYGGGGGNVVQMWGAMGGSSAFGGAGGSAKQNSVGGAGATNSGGGGGGGGGNAGAATGGAGGGAGGFVDAIIAAPSATYAYAVGAAGTAGTAGTGGTAGGAGGSGVIIVEEYYQ